MVNLLVVFDKGHVESTVQLTVIPFNETIRVFVLVLHIE